MWVSNKKKVNNLFLTWEALQKRKKRKREMVIYSFLKVCENFLSTSSTTNATWSEDCGKKRNNL